MVTLNQPRSLPARAKRSDQAVVSGGFLLTVAVITGLVLTVFSQHLDSPLKWAIFVLSILPIFTTLYNRLLFLKGWFVHRRDVFTLHPMKSARTELPGVALIIASCKEPFEVAKMTFDCAYRARYSGTREIIVVDNTQNTDDVDFRLWKSYVESHAGQDERVRVVFRHNLDSAGKKPGNIDLAQRLIVDSEYVVFLDIDSSLPLDADLLDTAVSKFEDNPKLGVLQFHTVPTNNHFNRLSRAVAVAQHALRMTYLMRANGGFGMFYGHNAMWRRSLLNINGSWLEHYRDNVIVTEDLLKTLGVYTHGYSFEYMNVPTGEWVPSSLKALDSMWMRWTYGGFQVLFKYFRRIVTAEGLSRTQRVDLGTMLVSYGTSPLIYPLAFLWLAVLPVAQAAALTCAILWLPMLLCAWVMWRHHSGSQRLPIIKRLGDIYAGMFLVETFILAVQARAVVNFVAGKRQGWRVTAKGTEDKPRGLEVLLNNRFMVALASLTIVTMVVGWGFYHGFAGGSLFGYLALVLIPIHLLLCIIVYGGEAQGADEDVLTAVIDPAGFEPAVDESISSGPARAG